MRLLPESEWHKLTPLLEELNREGVSQGPPMPGIARVIVDEDEEGNILGFLQYQRVLHVGPLYVREEHRGDGVASRLADFCREILPDGTRAFVQSDRPQVEAIVSRLGFEELKVRTFAKGVLPAKSD